MLATLVLGDLVTGEDTHMSVSKIHWRRSRQKGRKVALSHVVGQLLEVRLLLGELLLELEEPLLLALADGVVLAGALTALEGVAVSRGVPGLAYRHFPFFPDPVLSGLAGLVCLRG